MDLSRFKEPLRKPVLDYLAKNKFITFQGLIIFGLLLNNNAWTWPYKVREITNQHWSRSNLHKTLKRMEKDGVLESMREDTTRRHCYRITAKHAAIIQRFEEKVRYRLLESER